MEKLHETAWKIEAAECIENDDGTQSLILSFQADGKRFAVTVTGAAPLMLKQAINAFRAGAAQLCLENGIEMPDARWARPDETPPADGAIN